MADYKTIHGTTVKSYTTDPDTIIEGQVWYDKTNKVLQFEVPNVTSAGAWRTGGNLNTARRGLGQAGVSNSSGLAFGGLGPPTTGATENYNGSLWTEVADLNTARYTVGGSGTVTAAIAHGGGPGTKNETETWNGSSWTEVNNLNTGRNGQGSSGIITSALAFGGGGIPDATVTESWNGTSWTEVNNLNTGRYGVGGTGASNTASLAFGGGPDYKNETESWNGSSWTEVNNLNT